MRRHKLKRWLAGGALATSCFLGGMPFASALLPAMPPEQSSVPQTVVPAQLAPAAVVVSKEDQPRGTEAVPLDSSKPHAKVILGGPPTIPSRNSAGEKIVTVGQAPANNANPAATVTYRPATPEGKASLLPRATATISFSQTMPTPLPKISLSTESSSGFHTRFPRAEPGQQRRTFVDLTAAPCFAHASDYKWIVGRAEYSNIAKAWRLRYASVDETDRFGGQVTLIENRHVAYLKDGMYVRVWGHLVNPESSENGHAYYRIDSYEVVENPNQVQTTMNRK